MRHQLRGTCIKLTGANELNGGIIEGSWTAGRRRKSVTLKEGYCEGTEQSECLVSDKENHTDSNEARNP